MQNRFLITTVLVALANIAFSQNGIPCFKDQCKKDSAFCDPGIIGLQRPKGLVLRYGHTIGKGVSLYAPGNSPNSPEFQQGANRQIDAKLKFPVVNIPGFTVALGLRLSHERFRFEDNQGGDNPITSGLEDKSLLTRGADLYVVKPFQGKNYLLFKGGAKLSGEFSQAGVHKRDFMSYSATAVWGYKRNDYIGYGAGIYFQHNRSDGRNRFLPIIAYTHTFSRHWGIEAILPSSFKVRYSDRNMKTYIYASASINSSSYRVGLDEPEFVSRNHLELDYSEVLTMLTLEREVHDWLWLEANLGVRNNLGLDLVEGGTSVARGVRSRAVNFSMGIFIVPPRKWME